MNEQDKIKLIAKEEWRQLGYYCEIDDKNKEWKFTASPFGIKTFANNLVKYINNPSNAALSEHEHWCPYGYLEIMTWDKPNIDGHAIQGTLDDLQKLSVLIRAKATDENIGKTVVVWEDYSPNSEYKIILNIKEYGFDPSDME